MDKLVGLWIDHHKAVIVSITDEGEETHTVESNLDKHIRSTQRATELSAEDQRDRRFSNYLSKFYDQVVMQVRNAGSIWIVGPGEAKRELEKRLEQEHLGGRILGIEIADKMTDRQIADRVRRRYAK